MEIKKSPKADLEGKKLSGLFIGYVVVLAVLFVAFEWTKRDIKIDTTQAVADLFIEEEMVPITEQQEEIKEQTPPPAAPPAVAEVLEIVSDDADVEETIISTTEDVGQKVEVKFTPIEEEEEEAEEAVIFDIVEKMPEFPGGPAALMKYLSEKIKYPTISQENGVQGRVIVQFVVNKDGSIVDARVARGVDPYLDKEALRVVSGMPKWNPGMQRNKPVRVKYTVPVMFRLQ